MKNFLFACLLASLAAPLAAQNAPNDKKIVKITSEADLKNYENSLRTENQTKAKNSPKTPKNSPTPATTAENEYSEEELQKILEWYGQYAEENPTAFRSKNQIKPPKNGEK